MLKYIFIFYNMLGRIYQKCYLCKKLKTTMNITGTITGIKYSPLFLEKLKEVDIKEFDINKVLLRVY